jgi:hypothetical protein
VARQDRADRHRKDYEGTQVLPDVLAQPRRKIFSNNHFSTTVLGHGEVPLD